MANDPDADRLAVAEKLPRSELACLFVWGGNVNDKDKDRIDKLIRKAESVTGHRHDTLDRIYHKRITKKTKNILNDKTHPLVGEFDSRLNVRSGRLRLPTIRTERYRKSFIPAAISIFNSDHRRSSN